MMKSGKILKATNLRGMTPKEMEYMMKLPVYMPFVPLTISRIENDKPFDS